MRLLWAHSDFQVLESANEDTLEEPWAGLCLGRDCIDTSAGGAALGGAGMLLPALPAPVLLLSVMG